MSEAASFSAFSSQSVTKNDFRQLINELREQNFDTIRFATYRAACKLRFIQKKVNLNLVDIWNIIEAFRENGLNAVEYTAEVKISRIELLLSTVYHNLNKRLPAAQQIDTDKSIGLLLSFLLGAYDREEMGRLRVLSIKVALATLCAGKLVDKLRYVFSQISDSAGIMEGQKFSDYLREVLSLPTAVFEGPTFGFSDATVKTCFDPKSRVTVNLFLDTLMADPCPPCLMWLPLLHRMASVEHVFHPIVCDGCGQDSFTGFRYKCQRCHNYQLCQDCFWRGRVTGSHTNQHEMKEYSSYKSPTKQLEHSIGKSLRCTPLHTSVGVPIFPEHPDRPLDLSNVVPGAPSLVHDPRGDFGPYYDNMETDFLPQNMAQLMFSDLANIDDEHKLIARYSAKLAGRTSYPGPGRIDLGAYPDENLAQRATIARLEQRNKEIMREIQELQALRTATGASMVSSAESGVPNELNSLRHRKYELEHRMTNLQETRRDLMTQLEGLMRVLRSQGPQALREGSPRSPTSLTGIGGQVRSAFRDSTPVSSIGAFGSLGRGSRGPPGSVLNAGTLQGDLLSAADSITNTMSSLVKELDTGGAETHHVHNNNNPGIIDQRGVHGVENYGVQSC